MHTLYIKNMVCNRCILAVKQELKKLNIESLRIHLGEVELVETPGTKQMQQLTQNLHELGFELLSDQKQKQIERIKTLLIKEIQSGDLEEHFSITEYLAKTLHKDYSYLSRLFSQVEGITIEHYFIFQKIEKVKEWLVYGELSLSEISFRLGYNSVSHLSAQFKKVTGLTPTQFRKLGARHRKPLDGV